jgi:hypothetical protein
MDEREQEDAGPARGRTTNEPLRGLAAPGPSKVGTQAAMRARDVSRSGVTPREGRQQSKQGQSVGGVGSSGSSPVAS